MTRNGPQTQNKYHADHGQTRTDENDDDIARGSKKRIESKMVRNDDFCLCISRTDILDWS